MSATADHGGRMAANIRTYFQYAALKGLGFGQFAAVWVIYLQRQQGLSLAQATLVDVTFFAVAALGEVPTGIVADRIGRKASVCLGAALLALGVIGWTLAPSLPLIMAAYVAMGLGFTFTSGAEDALFYESLQQAGRGDEYAALAGRGGATFMGALALGSLSSGLLAGVSLRLPFLVSAAILLAAFGLSLRFKEPRAAGGEAGAEGAARPSGGAILRQALGLLRRGPALRRLMAYVALAPLASFIIENVLLQPQALALGVPIAGIGMLVMAVQLAGIAGAAQSGKLAARLGENRLLGAAPWLIIAGLALFAGFQTLPGLLLIGVLGVTTAVLRPILMNRLQREVPDAIRATMLSLQSLVFTFVAAITQPLMGLAAERAGFPSAYLGLAAALALLFAGLAWSGRRARAGGEQRLAADAELAQPA